MSKKTKKEEIIVEGKENLSVKSSLTELKQGSFEKLIEAFKLIGDSMLIKVIEDNEEVITKSGIVLPKPINNDNPFLLGKVIRVGPGQLNLYSGKRIPMRVNVGDTIAIRRASNEKISMRILIDLFNLRDEKNEYCYIPSEASIVFALNGEEVKEILDGLKQG